jgi:hypothetical protein
LASGRSDAFDAASLGTCNASRCPLSAVRVPTSARGALGHEADGFSLQGTGGRR